ncbi:hypothetical protein KU43_03805 [Mesotoga sp. SC_NapDC2]|nr:hypothetical protein RM69_04025 [Mesotoga sp. SC_NapDC3]RIZ61245.1 hypothetical protein KU43_03805 [Mesotoga sp. SC_NapDC2]
MGEVIFILLKNDRQTLSDTNFNDLKELIDVGSLGFPAPERRNIASRTLVFPELFDPTKRLIRDRPSILSS